MSDDDLFLPDALHYRETERDARVRRLRVAAHAAATELTRSAMSYPDRKAVGLLGDLGLAFVRLVVMS